MSIMSPSRASGCGEGQGKGLLSLPRGLPELGAEPKRGTGSGWVLERPTRGVATGKPGELQAIMLPKVGPHSPAFLGTTATPPRLRAPPSRAAKQQGLEGQGQGQGQASSSPGPPS